MCIDSLVCKVTGSISTCMCVVTGVCKKKKKIGKNPINIFCVCVKRKNKIGKNPINILSYSKEVKKRQLENKENGLTPTQLYT